MLAQSFLPAAELGLTDEQHSALIKTLALMDGGQLKHVPEPKFSFGFARTFDGQFNMMNWRRNGGDCGSVCCIGGTAEIIGNVEFDEPRHLLPKLNSLFYPDDIPSGLSYRDITVPQAAMALRSYLTTGDARWDLALADQRSLSRSNDVRV